MFCMSTMLRAWFVITDAINNMRPYQAPQPEAMNTPPEPMPAVSVRVQKESVISIQATGEPH